jgi:predicted XRE-type DNA-binding protein
MSQTTLNMQIRGQLAEILVGYITNKGCTQARAAQLLQVTQPRVSNLMQRKINLFTIDMLVTMLNRIGYEVQIVCSQKSELPQSALSKETL